jgi:hypothetical protein
VGGLDLRLWIELTDVAPELFEQAYDDDNLDTILNRRRLLFSYFRASTETTEEAERLAFALAAVVFPAFRPQRKRAPGSPGRPPAARPKYEVPFLENLAKAYDSKKSEIKSKSTTSTRRVYTTFLKENPDFANKLKVGGKPLSLSSFNKLLAVGRLSCKYSVFWYKDLAGVLPLHARIPGKYVTIYPVGSTVYSDPCYWPNLVVSPWLTPDFVLPDLQQ